MNFLISEILLYAKPDSKSEESYVNLKYIALNCRRVNPGTFQRWYGN